MTKFKHDIDASFVKELEKEAKKDGWWVDVLADPSLFVALRGHYLNVYWRGQSLFYVEPCGSGLNVTTHEKFLIDPGLASQVRMKDGVFDIEELINHGFIRQYDGKATLEKMKRAANYFAGDEKRGCHEIAVRNSCVIDCEIAFPGFALLEDESEKKHGRIDLAALEEVKGEIQLVFWEAKDYSNKELRSSMRKMEIQPPVLAQMKRYQNYLSAHREMVLNSYKNVAANLLFLQEMGAVRPLSPLITEVAMGKRPLELGKEPKVGLIIFGFDKGQRDSEGWKDHLKRLEDSPFPVKASGKAKGVPL